jgi:hypothetical protein
MKDLHHVNHLLVLDVSATSRSARLCYRAIQAPGHPLRSEVFVTLRCAHAQGTTIRALDCSIAHDQTGPVEFADGRDKGCFSTAGFSIGIDRTGN